MPSSVTSALEPEIRIKMLANDELPWIRLLEAKASGYALHHHHIELETTLGLLLFRR